MKKGRLDDVRAGPNIQRTTLPLMIYLWINIIASHYYARVVTIDEKKASEKAGNKTTDTRYILHSLLAHSKQQACVRGSGNFCVAGTITNLKGARVVVAEEQKEP